MILAVVAKYYRLAKKSDAYDIDNLCYYQANLLEQKFSAKLTVHSGKRLLSYEPGQMVSTTVMFWCICYTSMTIPKL